MAGLLVISSVTGTTPDWNLVVTSSAGVVAEDFVLCGMAASQGGIFRVTSVPDTTHIVVRDDVGPYGQPVPGEGSYWTPEGLLGLSQVVHGAKHWDVAHNRDFKVISAAARGVKTLTNPSTIIAADIDDNEVILIDNTTPSLDVAIEEPTKPAGLLLTIVNITSSTESLDLTTVVITLAPGEAKSFVWDGTAWLLL